MPLYKDPRTGVVKEFNSAAEAAGEGYFQEVKLDFEEFNLPEGSEAQDLLIRTNEQGQQVDKDGNGTLEQEELVHFIVEGLQITEDEMTDYASRGQIGRAHV